MYNFFKIIMLLGCLHLGLNAAISHAQDAEADAMVLSKDGKLSLSGESKPVASAKSNSTTTLETSDESAGAGMRWFGIILALGGMCAYAWLLKRKQQGKTGKKVSAQGLEIVERISIGARRELLLVKSGPRMLVLASMEQDLKLVTSISQTDWLMHYDDQALLSIMEQAATRNGPEVEEKPQRTRTARTPMPAPEAFDFNTIEKSVEEPANPWDWPAEKVVPAPARKPVAVSAPRKGGLWESA